MSDFYGSTGEVPADSSGASDVSIQGTAEEATQQTPASQPVLSPAQVQQMIESALAQNNQQWARQMQSQMDKRAAAVEANVMKRVEATKQQADQVVKTAKDSGLDDAAASALGQRFLNDNISNLLAESQQQQPPARNGQQQSPDDYEQQQQYEQQQVVMYQSWITGQGDQLRDAYGMPYDAPEMGMVITNLGEQEYFESIKAAGKAYQQRIAKAQAPARPARMPGLGPDGAAAPRNAIATIENTSELYKLAAQQDKQRQVR